MEAHRQRDQIIVVGAKGQDKRYLAMLPWPYSATARGYVIPEWAWWGLPKRFTSLRIGGDPPPKKPDTLSPLALANLPKVALYPFQVPLAMELTKGPHGLWADAGVGKTVTTLAAYKLLREAGEVDGMIVIGPENGRHVWCGPHSESARWIQEPGHYVESGGDVEPPTEGIIYTTAAKTFLSPYHGWISARIQSRRFVLCVDEAHMVSGALSKRFAVIRAWSRYAKYRWLLSATPTSNYPDSFWALYVLLTQSTVKLDAWVSWFRQGEATGSKSRWRKQRLEALGKYLAWCTSVVRKDVVAPHLPPVTEQIYRIPLVGKQRALYSELIGEATEAVAENRKQVVASKKNWQYQLVYLSSMASHPLISGEEGWRDADIAKLGALRDILAGVGDQKVCVWSWHPGVLDWLAKKLGAESCVVYHGGTAHKAKSEAVARFNEDPETKYFLGNPSAAGTSLNLGAGTVRIFWDLSWSYVQYHQACERINRITRTKPITSHVLIAENTVEETMWRSIQRKEELAGYITSEAVNSDTGQQKDVLGRWKD